MGGDLVVEAIADAVPLLIVRHGANVLARAHGSRIVHRLAPSFSGIIDVTVSPSNARLRASMTFEGWPTDSDGKPIVPWNFWYYPYNPTPGGFPSRDVQLDAMRKYDRLAGLVPKSGAYAWERDHHCIDGVAGWEGHCDPSAYASVLFEQPPGEAVSDGIIFTRNELELLAAEWSGCRLEIDGGWNQGPGTIAIRVRRHPAPPPEDLKPRPPRRAYPAGWATHLLRPSEMGERVAGEPREKWLGDRYLTLIQGFEDWKEHEGEVRTEAAKVAQQRGQIVDQFGKAGLELWRYLIDEYQVRAGEPLSGLRRPIVGDFGPAIGDEPGQVWNHAVALVRMKATERSLDPGYNDPPDPRDLDARIEVFMNLDQRPSLNLAPEADPANHSAADVVGGRPVPRPGCHQSAVYTMQFDFRAHAVTQRPTLRWLRATLAGSEAYAPRKFGSPKRPEEPDPNASPRSDAGNSKIGSELLQLIRLRGRYR